MLEIFLTLRATLGSVAAVAANLSDTGRPSMEVSHVARHCSRTARQRGRAALAAAVFSACAAAPALAQQDGAIGPLNLSASVAAAASGAAQASSAQSSDSAVLAFFKNTEVSGFVDTYYSYNG